MQKKGMSLLSAMLFCLSASADESLAMERVEDLSVGMAKRADDWLCWPNVMRTCSKSGCEDGTPSVWVKVDFKEGTFSRCDAEGCDDHHMKHKQSGIYTIVEVPGSGAFLKSFNDGEHYVEIGTLGISVIQNYGACRPID